MIENFTLDTDANPENMNKIIRGINKNEEDISGLKTSVEEVGSQIGQKANQPININPDFKIWQRYNASDATTFTNPSNKYIADRYRFDGTGTVKLVAGGAEIAGTINIKYILEDADFQKLNGKTLTRSWSENNVIQKETFICNNATIFDKTITDKVLNFIKIELGEIATPLSPRSYGEELALCQRYYRKLYGRSTATAIFPNQILIPLDDLTQMRIVPTLKTPTESLNFIVYAVINGINQTGFTLSLGDRCLIATKNAHGLTSAGIIFSDICLDSEIY